MIFRQIAKKIIVSIITLEARLVLRKYKPKIIAITGSVGKTTTKDMISVVLEKKYFLRSSMKSLNSELGVPLTVLDRESGWTNFFAWAGVILEGLALIFLKNHYPKLLILEIGTDRPGDISSIMKWLKPDEVVVTRFGETPVHIEFFETREALIDEKANVVRALKKDGTLFLNADDSDVLKLREETDARVVTFGFDEGSLIGASHPQFLYNQEGKPEGITAKIEYKGWVCPLKLYGILGKHFISSALAALALGIVHDVNIVKALEELSDFKFPNGRLKIISGFKDTLIIDDTYNSSPVALQEALRSFDELETQGRKICVLGDMAELGKYSDEEHKKAGAHASKICDVLVIVGANMKLVSGDNTKHLNSSTEAGEYLRNFIKDGDVILVKGSQSMRMEKAVEAILAQPEKKHQLLVRQEKEWQRR